MQFLTTFVSSILTVTFLGTNVDSSFFKSSVAAGVTDLRKAPRWNAPFFGIGMFCNGCPPSSCEDDEAIIHGYCCGCAYLLDKLPILCPQFLQCPLNLHGLCHDYEYMLRCCC